MKYILIVLLSISVWANDFDKGIQAYEKKDYKTAVKYWRPLAEKDDVFAQKNMAIMYTNGKGVDKNETEAFSWYKKAADLGEKGSQFYVGMWYYRGIGVQKDINKSIAWYTKSANQGYSRAQNNLGGIYAKGTKGLKSDDKKAISWWIKAARQDNFRALDGLSVMCQTHKTDSSCKEFVELSHNFCEKNSKKHYSVAHFCKRVVKLFGNKKAQTNKYWELP